MAEIPPNFLELVIPLGGHECSVKQRDEFNETVTPDINFDIEEGVWVGGGGG